MSDSGEKEKFESDWDLLKAICEANNKPDQAEVINLVAKNDFSDKPYAVDAAITAIMLTKDNVVEHKEIFLRFVETANTNELGVTAQFRFNLLNQLLSKC